MMTAEHVLDPAEQKWHKLHIISLNLDAGFFPSSDLEVYMDSGSPVESVDQSNCKTRQRVKHVRMLKNVRAERRRERPAVSHVGEFSCCLADC